MKGIIMLIDIPTRLSNITCNIRCIPAVEADNEMRENNGTMPQAPHRTPRTRFDRKSVFVLLFWRWRKA